MLAIKDKNINATKTTMGTDGVDMDYDERELEEEEKYINN